MTEKVFTPIDIEIDEEVIIEAITQHEDSIADHETAENIINQP